MHLIIRHFAPKIHLTVYKWQGMSLILTLDHFYFLPLSQISTLRLSWSDQSKSPLNPIKLYRSPWSCLFLYQNSSSHRRNSISSPHAMQESSQSSYVLFRVRSMTVGERTYGAAAWFCSLYLWWGRFLFLSVCSSSPALLCSFVAHFMVIAHSCAHRLHLSTCW